MKKTKKKKISTRKMIEDLKFKPIYMPDGVDTFIEDTNVNRPGLELAGFLDNFQYGRIQVIGETEHLFFNSLGKDKMGESIDRVLSYDIPLVVVSRKVEASQALKDAAKKYSRIIVKSQESTTQTVSKISNYLNFQLAPELVMHAVLVDVDGVGILITGESGVGKSETALELVNRNHRLIADDAVRIIKLDEDRLLGTATETLEHFMEIRGLGIIDVKSLYGIGAVKQYKKVDLVVELELWEDGKYYDRLGLDQDYIEILGSKVEKLTVPVRPGRNLGIIIELAARNQRQKSMGYNAAVEFNERIIEKLKRDHEAKE